MGGQSYEEQDECCEVAKFDEDMADDDCPDPGEDCDCPVEDDDSDGCGCPSEDDNRKESCSCPLYSSTRSCECPLFSDSCSCPAKSDYSSKGSCKGPLKSGGSFSCPIKSSCSCPLKSDDSCSCPLKSDGSCSCQLFSVEACGCPPLSRDSCSCPLISEHASSAIQMDYRLGFPGYIWSEEFQLGRRVSDDMTRIQKLIYDSSHLFGLDEFMKSLGEDVDMDKLNPRDQAKYYLASNKIPQMFESLISALMVVMPDDPVTYIEERMVDIRRIGLDKVNWETFVYHLHPYRHPLRLQLIRDGSKFDQEYSENLAKVQQQLQAEERLREAAEKQKQKGKGAVKRQGSDDSIKSDDTLAGVRGAKSEENYKSDVFQLTEARH